MTEKIKNFINFSIPVWSFSVVIPILLAFISFTINANARANRNDVKIEIIEKNIENKVDKSRYDADNQYIRESLNRIEKKLDQHIARPK